MKKTRNILAWVGAHVAASIVIGGTAYAQFNIAVAPTINNDNLGSTVGINTGTNTVTTPFPPPAWGTSCDPLDIGNVGAGGVIGGGPVPALRLSNIAGVGVCGAPNFNYGQLGYETTGGGVFSTLSGLHDIVLANRGRRGDIFIASRATNAAGVGLGSVRFSTVNGAGAEIQRMSIENNGNVGIGMSLPTTPQNRLDVAGSAAIGAGPGYAGATAAPANGMIVQGAVGIGNNAPGGGLQLDVTGNVNMSNDVAIGNNVTAGNNITAGNDVTVGGNLNLNTPSLIFDGSGSSGGVNEVLSMVGGVPRWAPLPPAGGAWAIGGNGTAGPQALGSNTDDLPIIAGAGATTWIYVDDPNGVAIGNGVTAATAGIELDVTGDVQFSGRLMPGGLAGTGGEVLVSGGGGSPVWTPATTVVGSSAWTLTGNIGTTAGTNFVGTGDNINLELKAYNATMVKLISSGTSGTVGQVVIGGGAATVGAVNTINGVTQITGNTTVTGTFTVSDARLKQNVVTLDNALARVMKLRGVEYDFRPGVAPELNLPKTHQVGMIAQEVEEVVPEVINEAGNGYKSIAYQNLVGLLVESTKEQQSIIESQRATIDNLSARLARLESLIDPSSKPVTPNVKEEVESIQLEQNTPNPFDRTTIIRYMVPNGIGSAEMVIFEAGTGREVERFIIANRGEGEVTVSVAGLAAGSYVYGIVADGKLAQTRTMVVAR